MDHAFLSLHLCLHAHSMLTMYPLSMSLSPFLFYLVSLSITRIFCSIHKAYLQFLEPLTRTVASTSRYAIVILQYTSFDHIDPLNRYPISFCPSGQMCSGCVHYDHIEPPDPRNVIAPRSSV